MIPSSIEVKTYAGGNARTTYNDMTYNLVNDGETNQPFGIEVDSTKTLQGVHAVKQTGDPDFSFAVEPNTTNLILLRYTNYSPATQTIIYNLTLTYTDSTSEEVTFTINQEKTY